MPRQTFTTSPWRVFVTEPRGWEIEQKIFIGRGEPIEILMQPAVMVRLEEPYAPIDDAQAFMSGTRKELTAFMQAMMDAAWDMGLKPKSYEEPTHAMKVQSRHLEDMRAIVSSFVKVEFPK